MKLQRASNADFNNAHFLDSKISKRLLIIVIYAAHTFIK